MKPPLATPATPNPGPLIDESVVSAYFFCPRKSFLLLRHRVQDSTPPPPTGYAEVLDEQAAKAKSDYLQRLDTIDRNNLLLDTVVDAADLRATCALLRKVDKPSKVGRFSYEPFLFIGTNSVSREHMHALGYLAHVLTRRQGISPKTGFVIAADARAHRVNLASLDKAVRSAVDAARAWSDTGCRDAPAVILNKHCSMCQFRAECEERARESDDLSLLHRMTPKLMRRYQKKGIFTVNQLSYVFWPRRNRKTPRRAASHFNVELQALAIRAKKIYLHEPPTLSRSPTEIFLDIEGIPDRSFHYLLGILVLERQTTQQHSFWADGPEHERNIWRAFLAIAKQHPSAPIYHYGSYEPKAIAELEEKYGKAPASLSSRLVNLSAHVFGNIYFPVRSNTLKEIGKFIGARWRSEDASGQQSLVWRYRWERTGEAAYKNQLLEYNEDDCIALRSLTDCVSRIKDNAASDLEIEFSHRPKQLSSEISQPIHAEFVQILKSAHLAHKGRRIKIRLETTSSEESGPVPKRQARPRLPLGRIKIVQVPPKRMCPNHHGEKLRVSKKTTAKILVTDLQFAGNRCRRVVTKYVGPKSYCFENNHYYYSPPRISKLRGGGFGRGKRFGSGFYAWVAYSRVVLRLPYDMISHVAQDMMGIHAPVSTLVNLLREVSERYAPAQKLLERRIVESRFVHADETRLNIRGRDQYVWVFTDGDRVAFRLTETRESAVVQNFLAGYEGILISDFYPGYDAVPCRQQKCWVHLIRDINNDLWKNPFDREFEAFVVEIRNLIVPIIQAVHKYGLKTRNLAKFEREVDRFYKRNIAGRRYQSEPSVKFHKRFERYRDSLFLFLKADGIPWENNMAERAIRQLAVQRKISGFFYEDGALQYLRLLGLAQTCRFQEKSFLRFLLSGGRDVDEFRMKGQRGFVWPQH